jgi:hypothetical protein
MSKMNSYSADDAKQKTATTPQVSPAPAITSNGTLAWNVRDILFGPDRSDTNSSHDRSKSIKSSASE